MYRLQRFPACSRLRLECLITLVLCAWIWLRHDPFQEVILGCSSFTLISIRIIFNPFLESSYSDNKQLPLYSKHLGQPLVSFYLY